MDLSPGVKLLLRLKRDWLVFKANEMGISPTGTKQQLAIRINQAEDEINSKYWDAISNREEGDSAKRRTN